MRRSFALLLVLGTALAASACAHVHPYQREHQAKLHEQLDEQGAAARDFENHMWDVREGVAGGNGKAGGGCGCN